MYVFSVGHTARRCQDSLAQGLPWEIPPPELALKGPAETARIDFEPLHRIAAALFLNLANRPALPIHHVQQIPEWKGKMVNWLTIGSRAPGVDNLQI
jgi:hypothetical protein